MKILMLIAICTLLCGSFFFVIKDWDNGDDIRLMSEDDYTTCPNFDGREFLLTGGTGTPETKEEVVLEMARLNKLCGIDN